jgi:hypothetical protein
VTVADRCDDGSEGLAVERIIGENLPKQTGSLALA